VLLLINNYLKPVEGGGVKEVEVQRHFRITPEDLVKFLDKSKEIDVLSSLNITDPDDQITNMVEDVVRNNRAKDLDILKGLEDPAVDELIKKLQPKEKAAAIETPVEEAPNADCHYTG
jgi:hypothetical protein